MPNLCPALLSCSFREGPEHLRSGSLARVDSGGAGSPSGLALSTLTSEGAEGEQVGWTEKGRGAPGGGGE